jgi:hypothetical protein
MTLGCGEGQQVKLEGGPDDKVFKLTQAPHALCEAMQKTPRSHCNDLGFASALTLHNRNEEAVSAVAQGRHEEGVLGAVGTGEQRSA